MYKPEAFAASTPSLHKEVSLPVVVFLWQGSLNVLWIVNFQQAIFVHCG